VESTPLQEICKGKGDGKEELPNHVFWSGIEEVHQVPDLINDPALLSCLEKGIKIIFDRLSKYSPLT
jgi:hypothetical protein